MQLRNRSEESGLTPIEKAVLRPGEFLRLTYRDAFLQRTGVDVLSCETTELRAVAMCNDLVPPPGLANNDRDSWLNFLLAELIEPNLGKDRPTFLTNYPASQAALARLSPDGLTAERFELYIDGIELCNGYDELTDASVLRSRICEQTAIRLCHGLRPLPTTNRLLDVMDLGLPSCAGNALGVDRLIMLALGFHEIADVISFPFAIA
jgi:lysyl-tRNA synthetase class 2